MIKTFFNNVIFGLVLGLLITYTCEGLGYDMFFAFIMSAVLAFILEAIRGQEFDVFRYIYLIIGVSLSIININIY